MKLAELRREKGLTQRELAQKFNLSSGNICDYEKGRIEPSIDKLIGFADFFGVTIDEILGRDPGAGFVTIHGEQLSSEEKTIVNCYRSLDAAGKKAFLDMAKNIAMLHQRFENN